MLEEFCDVCRVGKQKLVFATYTHWVESQLVILPHVPTRLCDVCGERIYDPVTVMRVEALLGVEEPRIEVTPDSESDPERSLVEHLWASGRRSV